MVGNYRRILIGLLTAIALITGIPAAAATSEIRKLRHCDSGVSGNVCVEVDFNTSTGHYHFHWAVDPSSGHYINVTWLALDIRNRGTGAWTCDVQFDPTVPHSYSTYTTWDTDRDDLSNAFGQYLTYTTPAGGPFLTKLPVEWHAIAATVTDPC
jgi:hypothetical protein